MEIKLFFVFSLFVMVVMSKRRLKNVHIKKLN